MQMAVYFLLSLMFISSSVFAQALPQVSTSTATTSTLTQPSQVQPLLGLKSYNVTGRARNSADPNGLRASTQNEVYLGAKWPSGWGGYVQGVQYGYGYGDPSL